MVKNNNKRSDSPKKNIELCFILAIILLVVFGLGIIIGDETGKKYLGNPIKLTISEVKEGKNYNHVPNISSRHLLIATPKGVKIFFAKDKDLADWIKENPEFFRKGNELISDKDYSKFVLPDEKD
ncbi:hypothetical protein ACFL23_00825 [Patescibacteria group bacterium]